MAQRKPDYDEVAVGPAGLPGMLDIPAGAQGIVLFAHGSGSGRFSPRNNYVAKELRRAGLATLLFDLLTEDEEGDRAKVFDIGLLATRLAEAAAWTARRPETSELAIGLFGSSTGAAAALVASVLTEAEIGAVVSRGGRPDLAGPALPLVSAPTLMLVGSLDGPVIELNKQAYAQLQCEAELLIVPGASHLFEEPGTLEEVVVHARDWFVKHLGRADAERSPHVPPRASLH